MASEVQINTHKKDENSVILNLEKKTEIDSDHLRTECTESRSLEEKPKCEDAKVDVVLLGSVTTSENPGLRTSARVIQKMKQDSIRPVTPPPQPQIEKKETVKDEKSILKTPNQPKPGRVVWTNLERNLFFDAVNEFGKDFDSIANSINMKIRRKNLIDPTFKTRDHIRQLYYQTFHKISKYVRFSDEIKKPAQELYAIINYGEIRRKLSFVSEKNCMKIKDLVYKGYVTIRNKGKTIRIKTPSCKALRRLNQLEEWQGDIKLPNKIEVRLKPATMESYGRVQNMAQNPIVRTIVPLQKKVISLIKTFQYKWRDQNVRLCEKSAKLIADNVEMTKHTYQEQLICLAPEPTTPIYKPMINISELLSNINICLNSYEEKVGVKVRGETLCPDRIVPTKRHRSDSGCEKKSPESKKLKIDADMKPINYDVDKDVKSIHGIDSIKVINSEEGVSNDNTKYDKSNSLLCRQNSGGGAESTTVQIGNKCEQEKSLLTVVDVIHEHNNANIDSQNNNTENNNDTNIYNNNNININATSIIKSRKKKKYKKPSNNKNNHILKPLLDDEMIKKIRQGWSMLNAGDITVGDLYLMFGKDSQVILEYFWVEAETKIDLKPENELESDVPYNHVNKKENKYEECLRNLQNNSLANKLRHLLIIANLSEKVQRKCNCGHICDNVFRPKKFENDLKSYVSNKTYTSSQSDYGVFRQPAAPFRRNMLPSEAYKSMSNGVHFKQNRFLQSRISPSKQVVVKRLLPLQPGVKQSYDIVTTQLHFRAFQRSLIEAGNLKMDFKSRYPIEEIEEEERTNQNDEDCEDINEDSKIGGHKVKFESNQRDVKIQDKKNVVDNKNKEISTSTSVQSFENSAETTTRIIASDFTDNNTDEKPIVTVMSASEDTEREVESDQLSVPHAKCGENDLFGNNFTTTDFRNSIAEDPGLKQLMEIPLPSPMPMHPLDDDDSYNDTPPLSPMRLLREATGDTKWLEDNLNDFSLSSLLGHLDEITPDVTDSANISLMSESSMDDYVAKFAELAASMQNQDKES